MATITVRRLDSVTWEPSYGNGQDDYIADLQAVGQLIAQRLKLFQGEWWENLDEGLPLWQSILGVSGAGNRQQATNLLIKSRIEGTVYVTGVLNVQSSYNPATRAYQFSCVATTQFGNVEINNIPTPPSQALP